MFKLAPDAVAETPAAEPAPVRAGDVLVLEAATAELALQEVAAKLGDHVQILAAEKVRRGGVGGFFSKELCRLTVRVPSAAPGAAAREADAAALLQTLSQGAGSPDAADGPAEPLGLDDMLRRLTEETTAQEAGFASVLRARMEAPATPAGDTAAQAARVARAAQASLLGGSPATGPGLAGRAGTGAPERLDVAPLPAPGAPVAAGTGAAARQAPRLLWTRDPLAPEGTGPVRWSAGMLERLGLPSALIAAAEAQEPVDDTGWLVALAGAVAPYCRPLPAGEAVLAGPRAALLAQALDVPVSKRPDAPPQTGTVCVPTRDTMPAREWLADVRAGRWLHLVVGGTGWHGLLFDEPLAVSWVGGEHLPAALHQCAAFGLVLGYGMDAAGGELLRANPVDVALSIRSLLPRR